MKSVLTPLAKSILLPLTLSTGVSAADEAIQKKIYGSGRPLDLTAFIIALIFSNKEMEYIMNLLKSLKASGLSIK